MKIGIIGSGISGLSLAHRLSDVKPIVIDPSDRAGGVMGSYSEPFFFERGPRTFQSHRCPELLELIEELGLKDAMIEADPAAKKRYILHRGKLRHPLRLPGVVWGLLTEWSRPVQSGGDRSVFEFFASRIGEKAANTVVDSFVTGIYAGDMHTLSMEHAFGGLMRAVQTHGSLTRSILARKKHPKGTLFSLRGGTEQLIHALSKRCEIVKSADYAQFDHIFCTTPYEITRELFPELPPFEQLFTRSLATINFAWNELTLPVKAFGYLVPKIEGETILGVVFDSLIFPQQNRHEGEVRLTVMMKEPSVDRALDALERHLGIAKPPDFTQINHYEHAIAHYPVGYKKRAQKWLEEAKKAYPNVTFCGGFLSAPSVNGRVSQAFQLAAEQKESLIQQELQSCT